MAYKKARNKPPFDATASALGYLYQCRFALLLALQRNEPDVLLSIERLDDVAFSTGNQNGRDRPVDLRQLKHHLDRRAGLGNKSKDIWRTLRIWAEAARTKTIDLDEVTLFMVTTSTATARHAIRHLSSDGEVRDPAKAQELLEAAGKESTAPKVREAFAALMKLKKGSRTKLFKSIYLLDGSLDIIELRLAIEKEVRFLTDPSHRSALADRLEGWWFRTVVEHLMNPSSKGIYVWRVEDEVHELREQFKRENLPDDFLSADVPPSETPEEDTRLFVRQLNLIQASEARIRSAQQDHYRAYEQRSHWVRQHLVGIDELHTLESQLTGEWKRRFAIMLEGLRQAKDKWQLVRSGQSLYEWIELAAPSDPTLFIRPEFRSKYMTRGSYQMLADKLRVGWHPHFKERLSDNSKESSDAS